MDIRQLRYFVAVAEEQNVSRAARRLHISQPPLTRQMHQMEQMLGTPLFQRSARGVELTDAGRMLLGDARRILESIQQAGDRARGAGLGQIGRIDLAVFGSVMLDTVPELLARFRATHPRVEVVLHTMNKGAQIEALRQHRITAGFSRLSSDHPDMAQTIVKAEQLMVALPAGHRLARRRRLRLDELEAVPLVLFASGARPNFIDTVYGLFQQARLRPQVSQTVEDAVTGVTLVAAGFGACLVPASVAHLKLPGVVYVPLAGIPPGVADLYCVVRRDDEAPVTRAFLATLQDFLAGRRTAAAPR